MHNVTRQIEIDDRDDDIELATRWQRFFGSIIDTIIMVIMISVVFYASGAFEKMLMGVEVSAMYLIGINLVGLVIFMAFNYNLLMRKGQTIGKKIVNIQIVDLDNEIPSPKTLLARYAFYFGISLLPLIGGIVSLINILFIFGAEKRCGHDQIANTRVIQI